MATKRLWGDLPVLGKILTAVLLGVLGAVGAGIVGIANLGEMDEVGGGIYERNLLPVSDLGDMSAGVYESRALALRLVISRESSVRAELEETLDGLHEDVEKLWAQYSSGEATAEEQVARDAFDTAFDAYFTVVDDQVVPAVRAGRTTEAANVARDRLDPAFAEVRDALTELDGLEAGQAAASAQQAEDTYQSARTLLITVLVIAVVLALVIGVFVARSISRSLATVVGALRRVEQGDLTVTADVRSGDELGQLATALNATAGGLREIIGGRMSQTAVSLAAAAEDQSWA